MNYLSAGLIATVAAAVAAEEYIDEPPTDLPNLVELQFSEDPYKYEDKIELIKTGILNLQGIRYQATSFSNCQASYSDVYGDFCAYDPTINKEDAMKYPTVSEAMLASDHCGDHPYSLPLKEVVNAVKSYDSTIGRINPALAGLIIHTGLAGAEDVTDAITTFPNTLVVSEHPALHDSLAACDTIRNRYSSDDCSPSLQQQLVSDVIMLSTRSANASLNKAYVRLHPTSTPYISMVREVVPNAAWVFHYNDPKTTLAKITEPRKNYCVYTGRQPSEKQAKKAEDYNLDLDGMSDEVLCALYLSTLLDAATEEHESTETGLLVDYASLTTDFIITKELPFLGLQSEIDADSVAVSSTVEEEVQKHSRVTGPPEHSKKVTNAANLFLSESNKKITEATRRQ
jgi:hypothetical protein